jgi:hypothetical protein
MAGVMTQFPLPDSDGAGRSIAHEPPMDARRVPPRHAVTSFAQPPQLRKSLECILSYYYHSRAYMAQDLFRTDLT